MKKEDAPSLIEPRG